MTGGLGQLDFQSRDRKGVVLVRLHPPLPNGRDSERLSCFPASRYATRAFTLIEMTVVIGIILVLLALAIPTLSTLTEIPGQGAVRTSLRGLCMSARTRAAQTQQYVGIRFQQDVLGRTLAVMVVPPRPSTEDPYYNYANGCPLDGDKEFPNEPNCDYLALVAVTGFEPVVLAKNVELAEGDIGEMAPASLQDRALDATITNPQGITNLADATTFTVVYSPAGQIVRKRVYVGQRAYAKPATTAQPQRQDTVFNLGGFAQRVPSVLLPDVDTQASTPRAVPEISQTSLYIYDRDRRIAAGANPFSAYVGREGLHIALNVYTGALIDAR